jgi:hypothetical protein
MFYFTSTKTRRVTKGMLFNMPGGFNVGRFAYVYVICLTRFRRVKLGLS